MKKRILVSAITLICLLLLLSANHFAAILFSKGEDIYPLYAESIEHLEQNNNLRCGMDLFSDTDEFKQIVMMQGWAFIPTTADNENKKISIYFVSDKSSYKVDAKVVDRVDVQAAFPELTEKVNHGFSTRFSIVNMKDGLYKVYMYDWENETVSGIADSGNVYIKQYGHLYEKKQTK